ncbi:MAG: 3-keto-disaccharide hydrolase [Ginsengibacter sp.]
MYKLTLSLFAIIISVGYCFAQDNTLTPQEKKDGWKLLFDGKTTNGWHSYGKETATKAWNVKDGTIYLDAEAQKKLDSTEKGDLVTNNEYENFDLKLDWKIGFKGNSGVIFYIHEDAAKYHDTYNTGMEMQVLDNGTPIKLGHSDAKLYTHRAGDLYDLLASKEADHLRGEWNHIEIKCVNGKLDFYMNGVHTLSTTLWNDYWRKMIAISKFKNMNDFGTFKEGKISLQDHDEDVWFKNIKIKRL